MNNNLKLTEHFSFYELTNTDHSEFLNTNRNNGINFIIPLKKLCESLEIIRETIKNPITILSGFRSGVLNIHINGSKTSQHMKGEAADIFVGSLKMKSVFKTIINLGKEDKLKWGQLIFYPKANFIHFSLEREKKKNNQILVYENEKYNKYKE